MRSITTLTTRYPIYSLRFQLPCSAINNVLCVSLLIESTNKRPLGATCGPNGCMAIV